MSGERGLATGLRRGGGDLPCLVSVLVDVVTLYPVTAGFAFFFGFIL